MKSLLGFILLSGITFAAQAPSQPKDFNTANLTTVKGCVAREIDGYYLISEGGEQIFLAGGQNVSQSVGHIAIVEGEEGAAANTYSGATGRNTIKGLQVEKLQTTSARCNRNTVPEPTQNPDSTYSPNSPT